VHTDRQSRLRSPCALAGWLALALLLATWGAACGRETGEELSPFRWQPAPPPAPGAQAEQESALLRAIGYLRGYRPAERAGGVGLHVPDQAWQGWNLYTSGDAPAARLIDMDGRLLHRWQLDYREAFPGVDPEWLESAGTQYWRRVLLLDGGDLIAIYDYHGLVRIDRDSRLVWASPGQYHHDLWLGGGRLWVLRTSPSAAGALPGRAGSVMEEELVLLDPRDGRVLRTVSLLDAFRRSRYAGVLRRLPLTEDVFHDNTIEILAGPDPRGVFTRGRALVSLRNIHTVAVVDLERERVVWATTGPWRMQHEPQILTGGSMLLFDNLGVPDYSRVLELDPFSKQVLWSYGGSRQEAFHSEGMGAQQRLPNGNTLITDSFSGRAFEVTPAGRVVWRFDNPARAGEDEAYVAVVPEMLRIEAARTAGWLRPLPEAAQSRRE
jgi:hypothetical protein